MQPCKLIPLTDNAKLGKIATTYAGFHTCPSDCRMKRNRACYGMSGPVGWHMRRLAEIQRTRKESHIATAKGEARMIRALRRVTPIRLHTAGDCKSPEAATIVSKASEEFMQRTGQPVYTYTHAWRNVPRASWGEVSVLASAESMDDVKKAFTKGYAVALAVNAHESPKSQLVDGFKLLPCPAQTGRVENCKKCKLCMKDKFLRKARVVITLAAHGPTRKFRKMMENIAS